MVRTTKWNAVCLLVAAGLLAFAMLPALAEDDGKPQEIVDSSKTTLENFAADPDMEWFRDHIKNAKAILIVPSLVKAGFIFGGSGGSGALLARDAKTGEWTYPAFYTMGSVTWGLQIGAEVAEVVLLVMSEAGMNSLLASSFKLGADASVAAGPVGAGAKASTADILSFSRAKGVFGGLTLEGSVISTRDGWNEEYYGKALTPVNILVQHEVSNAQADPLRKALMAVGK